MEQDKFIDRHIGPRPADIQKMLHFLNVSSLDKLLDQTIPAHIRSSQPMTLDVPRTEVEALTELKEISRKNQIYM